MADIGSRLPVPLDETVETKEMKLLWLESEIRQAEAKIAACKRTLLALEQEKDVRLKAQLELKRTIEL